MLDIEAIILIYCECSLCSETFMESCAQSCESRCQSKHCDGIIADISPLKRRWLVWIMWEDARKTFTYSAGLKNRLLFCTNPFRRCIPALAMRTNNWARLSDAWNRRDSSAPADKCFEIAANNMFLALLAFYPELLFQNQSFCSPSCRI